VANNRLIVWESGGYYMLPDEIIEHIFEKNRQYRPIAIGVEADGLEQFITQPLGHKAVAKGVVLPIEPLRAPRDKEGFIKQLQPFFASGEVILVGDAADHITLKEQLMNFPRGLKDVPNALAYALKLGGGEPAFPEFIADIHTGHPTINREKTRYVILNCDEEWSSATCCQFFGGRVHCLWDAVAEGTPRKSEAIRDLIKEARAQFGHTLSG
jgi:hypothetical protein